MRIVAVSALVLTSCAPGCRPDPILRAPIDRTIAIRTVDARPFHDRDVVEISTPTSTTSTAAVPRPRPVSSRANRGTARSHGAVVSTAYCETGRMASGARTYVGAAAGNRWPLGTVLNVSNGPYGPGQVVIADRIGHGSDLDFATPGDCALARRWGRRSLTVEEVR